MLCRVDISSILRTMKKLFRNNVALVFVGILILGGFLRLYHVGEWMHYELDQARDYRVIHTAIERGPGYLPLQGPKAAGNVTIAEGDAIGYGGKTTLRLGPLFYYIEYVSALLFGDSPLGSIMLIVIFSIATIALFYVFAREFFSRYLSLGLMALFAVSLFFVSYSRFGWNPNLMPFFTLLTFYAVLRVARFKEGHRRERGWWLLVASGAFAFLSQMHFLAVVTVPVIAGLFLLWTRPKISWRFWIGSVLLFVALNTPLIINDIKTGGENTQAFLASLHTDSGSKHSFMEQITKNISEHVRYNWIILSGYQEVDFPVYNDGYISCDDKCKKGLFAGSVSLLIILAGFLGSLWVYKKTTNRRERNFIRLCLLWYVITFVIYTPLAYDFAPRFFLIHAPVSLILIGMILHVGLKRGKRRDIMLSRMIIGLLLVSNLVFVGRYFVELSHAISDDTFTLGYRDRILGEKTRMTLAQLNEIADYMIAVQATNGFPLFIHGQSEFKRALWERVDRRGIARSYIPRDLTPIYREGNYFLVLRTQADHAKHLAKFKQAFTLKAQKSFGTLTLFHLIPKENAISAQRASINTTYHDPRFSDSAQPRYLWHQVFAGCRYDYSTDLCTKK